MNEPQQTIGAADTAQPVLAPLLLLGDAEQTAAVCVDGVCLLPSAEG